MDLKKTKKILLALFAVIIVFILLGLWQKPFYIAAVALTVVYVVVYWRNWRCPNCKEILGRGIGTRCPHCGEDAGIDLKL